MKAIRIMLTLTLVFILLGINSARVNAASCKNQTCEDKNPQTMGCGTDAVRSGSAKILPDGLSYIETRKSTACDAKWARTTNASGSSEYAAASLRYGGSNYDYTKNVSSPGVIANWQTVYTPMHMYVATPARPCGKVSTSGPISVPISLNDSWCTGSN